MQFNIPKRVQELLHVLNEKDQAHIAGGFVRDSFLKRPFRDVDCWCLPKHADRYKQLLLKIKYKLKMDFQPVSKGLYSSAHIKKSGLMVFRWGDLREGLKIDLMFTSAPISEVVDGFDLGINQAWLEDGQIRFKKAFMQDHLAKVIRLTKDEYALDYKVIDRAITFSERLKYKYDYVYWDKLRRDMEDKRWEERKKQLEADGKSIGLETIKDIAGMMRTRAVGEPRFIQAAPMRYQVMNNYNVQANNAVWAQVPGVRIDDVPMQAFVGHAHEQAQQAAPRPMTAEEIQNRNYGGAWGRLTGAQDAMQRQRQANEARVRLLEQINRG